MSVRPGLIVALAALVSVLLVGSGPVFAFSCTWTVDTLWTPPGSATSDLGVVQMSGDYADPAALATGFANTQGYPAAAGSDPGGSTTGDLASGSAQYSYLYGGIGVQIVWTVNDATCLGAAHTGFDPALGAKYFLAGLVPILGIYLFAFGVGQIIDMVRYGGEKR